jgi:hypothetical protein
MISICASVVCPLLVLHNFILKGSTKPHSYEVWIMTLGDDDPGDDPSGALDDWPSEIAVPADFFTDTKAEAACGLTLAAGRAGLN